MKHPKGLFVLFFTEMWERFGYYLMLGIFSLYMLDAWESGGMGFSSQQKSDIYGTYIGLVYLTPFIGGILADRILGYRKSIIIGGLLMSAGYIGLSIHDNTSFYLSLLLIILGNGFFKPNISTLVGNLYNHVAYREHKDAGFNIFYMGINVGAFICNFVAAYMRINFGWGYAFLAAGIGLLLGLFVFVLGTKHIKEADVIKPLEKGDMSTGKIFLSVVLPMFTFGILGYLIPGNLLGSDTNDAFAFGCLPVITFFFYLWKTAHAADKKSISALLSVYICIIVFWAVFHQNGDALTVWANNYTDREMPASMAGVASTIGLAEEVTNLGNDTDARSAAYFRNLPSERVPEEGKSLLLVSTEIYQSVNPFWVVVLTPVIIGVFGFLNSRRKEPTTASKITIGLFITALSALVMIGAVNSVNIADEKASSWWLIATYGVVTIGELCLSPMGLSLVSKLSPPRITALMMGGFFLSTSVGNKLSGVLSGMWERYDDKTYFFLTNVLLLLVASGMMLLLLKRLNKTMKERGV
ncbi:MAG: peptide MFS transporter [Dysgonamonadaceae bacterium]|jgi:POT family proton-dependent oligopeptide transporter|nr:peptide MFS transporter [Dysgonamonadaceae bacterium]